MRYASVMFIRHEITPSNILRTVRPRIIKYYMDIHTDIVYSNTRHDVIIYFQSEVVAKNRLKYHLRQLWVKFLENGIGKYHKILHTYRGQTASQTFQI